MIRYIKYLLNIESDDVNEINNILNDNPYNLIHIELSNKKYIKMNINNCNINYFISEKYFENTLNNLIINNKIFLRLSFIEVYHKEIHNFIKKNKIRDIHLENFRFPNLLKLKLNLCTIKCLTLNLKETHDEEELVEILAYAHRFQYLETLCYAFSSMIKLSTIEKHKFSSYKSEINLDFHYNNINFIYM